MKLGILSDAHGNFEAFNSGLSLLENRGAETFMFLGDAIGYIPKTDVVASLMNRKIPCILGNHEEKLLSKAYSQDQDEIYKFSDVDERLTITQRHFISSWPQSMSIDYRAGRCLFLHGTPEKPTTGYCYPDSELSIQNCIDYKYIFMGNTHRPFIRQFEDRYFINVGSCGLPRDCGYLGSVCLFDTIKGTLGILRFDIKDTNAAIISQNQVHSSVISLLKRESEEQIYGELIKN